MRPEGSTNPGPRETQMSSSKFDGKGAVSAVAMVLAALASIHCGSSSGGGNGGGGAATTSTATGGAQPTSTGTGMSDPTCASAALCDEVGLTDPSICGGGSGSSSGAGGASPGNATAARCILTKLRDRATGYVAIFVDSGSPVPCGQVTELVSFGDGSASISNRRYYDLGATASPSTRGALKPVAYFETCLAGDDAAAIDCLSSLITGAAVAGDTCPCRGSKNGMLSGSCPIGP